MSSTSTSAANDARADSGPISVWRAPEAGQVDDVMAAASHSAGPRAVTGDSKGGDSPVHAAWIPSPVADTTTRCPPAQQPEPAPAGGAGARARPRPGAGQPWRTITEGSAVVLYGSQVFYNPVQLFNRDLSVFALRTFDERRKAAALARPRDARKTCGRQRALLAALDAAYGSEGAASAAAAPAGDPGPIPPDAPMPGLTVCEALSATGLRAVRYALEVPGLTALVANDLDPSAVAAIQRNLKFNGLTVAGSGVARPRVPPTAPAPGAPSLGFASPAVGVNAAAGATAANAAAGMGKSAPGPRIYATQADAASLLYAHREGAPGGSGGGGFDVVDLDPYGSASPFLDAAVQAVSDGGMLAVTCTDMAVLAGNNNEQCRAKYGSMPVRARHCHEQALRIVLASIETHANRYRRTIRPLLCISVDFYVRLFVTVHISGAALAEAPLRMGNLLQCTGCDSFWLWPLGHRAGAGGGVLKRPGSHGQPGGAAAADAERTSAGPGSAAVDEHSTGELGKSEDSAPAAVEAAAGGAAAAANNDATRKRQRPASAVASGEGATDAAAASPPARASSIGGVVVNTAPEVGRFCPCCGRVVAVAGPVWLGQLHDTAFASAMLEGMTREFGPDGRGVPGAAAAAAAASAPTGEGAAAAAGTATASATQPPLPPATYYDLTRTVRRPAHDGGSNDAETTALSRRRVMGVLRSAVEELPDVPLYYDIANLTCRMHARSMPQAPFLAALANAGYAASGSHAQPNCVKTDAPPEVLWHIVRSWDAAGPAHPPSARRDNPNTVAHALLVARAPGEGGTPHPAAAAVAPAYPFAPLPPVVFNEATPAAAAAAAARHAAGGGGPRFVPNPGANWGPRARAGTRAAAAEVERRVAGLAMGGRGTNDGEGGAGGEGSDTSSPAASAAALGEVDGGRPVKRARLDA
jgi:tRNA G26 N,N-dimethylase Trm1